MNPRAKKSRCDRFSKNKLILFRESNFWLERSIPHGCRSFYRREFIEAVSVLRRLPLELFEVWFPVYWDLSFNTNSESEFLQNGEWEDYTDLFWLLTKEV